MEVKKLASCYIGCLRESPEGHTVIAESCTAFVQQSQGRRGEK